LPLFLSHCEARSDEAIWKREIAALVALARNDEYSAVIAIQMHRDRNESVTKYFETLILLLASLAFLYSIECHAQTTLVVNPTQKSVRPFSPDTIQIIIKDAVNISAASVTVAFDSTVVQYRNTIAGSFLTGHNLYSVFLGVVPQPPPPATPCRITIDQAILGGRSVSGSGVLCSIIFSAQKSGTSDFSISSVDFRNETNAPVLIQTVPVKVRVNNAPSSVRLLIPQDGCILDTSNALTMVWSKSYDLDAGDRARYRLNIKSKYSEMNFTDLPDTAFALTKELLSGNTEYTWTVDVTDGVDTVSSENPFKFKTATGRYAQGIPKVLKVEQNYPNPFNSSTIIMFTVSFEAQVIVKVYDLLGREIVQLMNARVDDGEHWTSWDGRDHRGSPASSGIYLYEVSAGGYREVKKMLLIK